MADLDYRIISIGTLSSHPLWNEPLEARTGHATTTLIRSEDRVILVDPSLPAEILGAKLKERSGLEIKDITDVFLTDFSPEKRRGLMRFQTADWWVLEAERESIGQELVLKLRDVEGDTETENILKQEISILQNCKPAPDKFTSQVDLFPLPGFSPGTCGLLIKHMNTTVVVAGDAMPTVEHLEQGKVLQNSRDVAQAQESFQEVIEIADWIIPGHDNIVPNRTKRPF